MLTVAALVTTAAVADTSEEEDAYGGNLDDLLISTSDLPSGYVEGVVHYEDPEEGWTFVEAPDCGNSKVLPDPLDYRGAIYWYLNDDGDAEGSIIQIVLRYDADDIDEIFDTGNWEFVPAPGMNIVNEETDVRAKILSYRETETMTCLSLIVSKKDIAITFSYCSSADFNPDIAFSLATEAIQNI